MIQDRVFSLDSFQRQYEALLLLSVGKLIPNLEWANTPEDLVTKINWNNILSLASILSHSSKTQHLDAALRIAQTCLTSNTTEIQKNAAVVILESLTNQPAIALAISRGLVSPEATQHLPLPFKLQMNRQRIANSVTVNETVLELNAFQKGVFDDAEIHDGLSISAPTSAGKSFILYQLLIKRLTEGPGNIVYVVPTRALISQVEDDLIVLLKDNGLTNVSLSTVPQPVKSVGESNIFVFTQERLHWFLIEHSPFIIDLLLVDEAHKIQDGNRGILLQQKIEEVVKMNPDVKVFFSSPFTANPEVLLKSLRTNRRNAGTRTDFVAVNQNLLYIRQIKYRVKDWAIDLVLPNNALRIGVIHLRDRPTTETKKIAFISQSLMQPESGMLVYANGAAEAEKFAQLLFDMLPSVEVTERLQALIDLVRKTIHPDYVLAKVLRRGIAFHYGNIPLLVREEIERLFKLNEIGYLVCTSTLLEGVNLPASSVVLRKPTRGRGKALNHNDFWNLAGRAGRWGKEFCGNIVCIEPEGWEIPPSPEKRRLQIVRALDRIEETEQDVFVNYILSGTPRVLAEKRQDFEHAFGYYYTKFVKNEFIPRNPFHDRLFKVFEDLRKSILIPNDVVFRNPGISPIAQQNLLEFFEQNENSIEDMLPAYPEDAGAFEQYAKLVERIGGTLASYPPQLHRSRAVLLINWMSGRPLAVLIQKSIDSYRARGNPISTGEVIRQVMENVENFVRFRFAKDSSCYVDVLRFFLELRQREDLLDQIPQLNQWLEFGVSQKTHLSLLALGLSRHSVVALSEFISNSQLTKEESLDWLRSSDVEYFGLSPIILNDIRKCL